MSWLFFTLKKNKKGGILLGHYECSEELPAILYREKNDKTTNGLRN
jgi:hypothetical protein